MVFRSTRLFSEIHYVDSGHSDQPDEQYPIGPEVPVLPKNVLESGEQIEGTQTAALRIQSDSQEIVIRVAEDGVWLNRGPLTIWVKEDGSVRMWPRSDLPDGENVIVSARPGGECELAILGFDRVAADHDGFTLPKRTAQRLDELEKAVRASIERQG